MTKTDTFSVRARFLLHCSGFRVTRAGIKILNIIDEHDQTDFTRVDIYKRLLQQNNPMPIATVTNNLRKLNEMGLLISTKTDIKARLYRKSDTFEDFLSIEEYKPYLLS